MRIGVDGRALQPRFKHHLGRGIGQYALELVRALAARGDVALTLFLDPALPFDRDLLPAGVATRDYPRAPRRLPFRTHVTTQTAAALGARSAPVDVFHFLAHGDAPAWGGGPRRVLTVHDVILEVMPELYARGKPVAYPFVRALERRAVRGAARIVVDSARTGADLARVAGVAPARVHVAHLGVATRFAPRSDAEIDAALRALGLARPYVLYLGGFDARKNVPGLLRAWARVRARAATAPPRLVLAGAVAPASVADALDGQVRSLGLDDVTFPGFVDDAHVPALLSGAALFVFPSLYEGFGLPPLEAMACGAPVVASDGGSLGEVLGDGARLVPAGDEAALAEAMLATLADPAGAGALRARGRARAARFTWTATAEATVAAYRAALAE